MWDTLNLPWQAALEMAWEAYCDGTIPIGAVIADADGNIITRGRNRIKNTNAPDGQICSNELAHAELNALLSLKLNRDECKDRGIALYTTMEPCPLCMGALYMSNVKTLHFAAREPWAGSTNLLGTTPYLSIKPFRVFSPFDLKLEIAITAIAVTFDIECRGEEIIQGHVFNAQREIFPEGVELSVALYHSGKLTQLKEKHADAKEVFEYLASQVK
jgi:tRNA(Arg) A34 adenosine deaminase TadA